MARGASWVSRDNRSFSIAPRAQVVLLCSSRFRAWVWGKDGVLANDIYETAYLAFLGRVPLLPVEDTDSAYVVFVQLFDQPVPPKNVAVFVRGGSEVEPLRDESGIADGWKESIPNSSRLVGWRMAYNTTTFPCNSSNRDETILSTCGLVTTSRRRRETWPTNTHLFFRRNGTRPKTPIRRDRESHRRGWWEECMRRVTDDAMTP